MKSEDLEAAATQGHPEASGIRVLDLQTGEERTLDTHPEGPDRCEVAGNEDEGVAVPVWLPDGRLVSGGDAGLRVWDLAAGTSRLLRPCRKRRPGWWTLLATPDSRTILRLEPAVKTRDTSSRSVLDLASGASRAW